MNEHENLAALGSKYVEMFGILGGGVLQPGKKRSKTAFWEMNTAATSYPHAEWVLKSEDNAKQSIHLEMLRSAIARLEIQISEIDRTHARMEEQAKVRNSKAEVSFTLVEAGHISPRETSWSLTPDYLLLRLSSYLKAVAVLQGVINQLRGRKEHRFRIRRIEQNSPFAVELDGAAEAIEIIRESITPWRREHAKEMARLVEIAKRVEIQSKKAELLELRARASQSRQEAKKTSAQALKEYHEAEKLQLQNEKLRLELQREKVELVLSVLGRLDPKLPEGEKVIYLTKLLPAFEMLLKCDLELV